MLLLQVQVQTRVALKLTFGTFVEAQYRLALQLLMQQLSRMLTSKMFEVRPLRQRRERTGPVPRQILIGSLVKDLRVARRRLRVRKMEIRILVQIKWTGVPFGRDHHHPRCQRRQSQVTVLGRKLRIVERLILTGVSARWLQLQQKHQRKLVKAKQRPGEGYRLLVVETVERMITGSGFVVVLLHRKRTVRVVGARQMMISHGERSKGPQLAAKYEMDREQEVAVLEKEATAEEELVALVPVDLETCSRSSKSSHRLIKRDRTRLLKCRPPGLQHMQRGMEAKVSTLQMD
mmetsp:Transcript_16642/g.36186  ORF Transcript_16642/g.36186 Transcript_16642/m.36186 type:complete len:290 (+) Transcript_16642:641-1510(+)